MSSIYEQRLHAVLEVIHRYMPPDGLSKALTEIIALVDPWPVEEAATPALLYEREIDNAPAASPPEQEPVAWTIDSYEPPDAAVRAGGDVITPDAAQALLNEELHPDDLALRVWFAMRPGVAASVQPLTVRVRMLGAGQIEAQLGAMAADLHRDAAMVQAMLFANLRSDNPAIKFEGDA